MGRAGTFYAVMVVLGLCWGLTIPAIKIALGAGHAPLGVLAWQVIYMTGFLTLVQLARRQPLFRLGRLGVETYVVIALTGTLVPGFFSFRATAELPAGVMAIVIALVPMFSLPLALALGLERAETSRILGVCLGAVAVALIAGPDASLPEGSDAVFVLVALIAPFCYGVEGNYLAKRGTGGLDALQVLWGASLCASAVAVPWAWATGAWVDLRPPWGVGEWAILAAAAAHGVAYVGYIWLVGQAGAVFAAQVAYLVTGAGVIWSVVLLGERYAIWVWLAFALMIAGVALVQPRSGRKRATATG